MSSGMLWVQAAWASPALIQDVQVSQIADAIEIRLDVTGSPRVFISGTGTVVVVDILDAQVARPIEKISPAQDIASVSLNTRDASSVRLTVIGQDPLPPVQVLQEGDQVRLIWGSPAALVQAQADPSPSPETLTVVPERIPVTGSNLETDEEGTTFELPQITVTAEKSEANVQEVPLSIRAIPREEIEQAGIESLKDIAENTVNFSVFPFSGRAFTSYTIRGLGNVNFLSRDAVGFFVDDVPFDGISGNILETPDIERVEVLRGPQSTLYGRSSQAGVVNVIGRRPTETFEANTQISYGNYNALNVSGSVSGPLANNLFYRLSGNYLSRDGFVINTLLNQDIDNRSGGSGRLQLLWTSSQDWEVLLNVGLERVDDQGLGAHRLGEDPMRIQQNILGFFSRDLNSQSLRVTYTQPSFQITSITARRSIVTEQFSDGDFGPADLFERRFRLDSELISQEIRVQSVNDEPNAWQWLMGIYAEQRENASPIDSITAASAAPPPQQGVNNVDALVRDQTLGIFGQASYPVTPKLTFTAGLRYETFRSELVRAENVLTRPDGSTVTAFSERGLDISGDILLPRVSLQYQSDPNLMLYGTVARGFRPGGVNPRPIGQINGENNFFFQPETSWNYEIGAKSILFNNRAIANLSIFHNPIENYQVANLNPDPPFNRVTTNARVSLTGAELEIQAFPRDNLEITAGIGVVDAHFANNVSSFTGQSFTGNRLNLSPNYSYAIAITYTNPSGFFGRAALQGYGSIFFDEANTLKQDPYSIFNVRLGYQTENLTFTAFADNLFDTRYNTFAVGLRPPIAYVGEPLTYGIRLQAEF